MSPLEVLAIAVALGLDAMSVSAAIGVRWHGPRQRFRLAWHMGLFQFLMPVLGWLGGAQLASLLEKVGSYVAAALVFAVACKMLYEAVRSHPGAAEEAVAAAAPATVTALAPGTAPATAAARPDPTRGWSLMALSVATSLDALVVGFSLGVKGASSIIWPSLAIGVVAAAMSLAGVIIGKRLGGRFGKPAEIAGAVVLMLLAVSFLVW
jgi:putative Mn2+ efflux pump MntP